MFSATLANGGGGWCYVDIYRPDKKGRGYGRNVLMRDIRRNLKNEKIGQS